MPGYIWEVVVVRRRGRYYYGGKILFNELLLLALLSLGNISRFLLFLCFHWFRLKYSIHFRDVPEVSIISLTIAATCFGSSMFTSPHSPESELYLLRYTTMLSSLSTLIAIHLNTAISSGS